MSRINKRDIIDLPEELLPRLETLTCDMRTVAELVGVRNALLLAQQFDGTPIQLWGFRKWVRDHRDRCMREEYDQGNISGVALFRKYGVSESWGWRILGRTGDEDNRQIKLFEHQEKT